MTLANDDFWRNLIVAGVGALLGFLFSYVIWQLSKRREVRRQISFDLSQQLALPAAAGSLAEPVSVKYGETEVSNLYFATLSVENTGNRVVHNQRVRLSVKGAKLLKWILDPAPEPEFGVTTEGGDNGADLALIIGQLELRQRVTLKVALSATETPVIEPVPYNAQGDVEFIPRSIKNRDDRLVPISRVIAITAALLILPGIVSSLPEGEFFSSVLQLSLLIALLPYAPKTIEAIALWISTRGQSGAAAVNHGLWVADGTVRVENMTVGPSGEIVVHSASDSSRIHSGIILLRDAVMQHSANNPDIAQILTQLADASKEIQSPTPDSSRLRELLESVRLRFAGTHQEPYMAGIIATMLMQFPTSK